MSQYTHARYPPLQVSLHWLVVVLVFATILLGKTVSSLPNESTKLVPIGIHMALGLIPLVMIVVRFIARLRLPKPVSVTTGNLFFDRVAKVMHDALYLLVFLMTVSGISLSVQSGLMPIVFGRSGSPLPADFHEFTARMLHVFLAAALLTLMFVHISAVFYHQFALKDNLLSRMGYGKSVKEPR